MKQLVNIFLLLSVSILLLGCGKTKDHHYIIEGQPGPVGAPGKDADAPINGVNGANGEDAKFQVAGANFTVKETAQYEGDQENQLTCMLGESSEFNRVVLRLRSKSGGLFKIEKAGGGHDLIYLPAALEVLIFSKVSSGTFKTIVDGNQSTKACSVP